MRRYLAFGEHLAADTELDYLEFDVAREQDTVPTVILRAGEVCLGDEVRVHAEPDFEGGPVLEVWMREEDSAPTTAFVDYAGWQVRIDAGHEPKQMIYARSATSASPEVALRAVCERVLMPLCLLLDPTRALFAMHGGAFVMNDLAWILIGESGAGKSTSALALVRSGARILADDMALVDTSARLVLPGAPTLRLWLDELRDATRSAAIAGTDRKHWFHLGDKAGQDIPVPLGGVIVLSPDPHAPVSGEIDRIRGLEALTLLLANGFELEHSPRPMREARVKRARGLLATTSVFRCRYARDPGGEPRQVESIRALIDDEGEGLSR